jgi:hypothetical protein
MPSRPDLRDLAASVHDAFSDCDRDTLLDILTFVVKEYVAEGPPPMLMHQAETIAELGGLSFAQLVAALQTRLDLPELGLFAVDGDRVSVRVGGVMHPLDPVRTPPAAELPRPTAGVRVVETNVAMRPPAPPAPAAAAPAPAASAPPPPSRGLSLRGRPGDDSPAIPPAAATPAPVPPDRPAGAPSGGAAAPNRPAGAPSAADDGGGGSGDDAAARFSLLELD